MQILILGMHRSGTSALTRLVNMMGAYFAPEGAELAANAANPKGYWERSDVMQVNNALLSYQQCRWDDVASFNNSRASFTPTELMQPLVRVVRQMDQHAPWVMKDPRLCVTLPCWRPYLSNPVGLVLARHPHEIARSLQQRDGMRYEHVLALWEQYCVRLLINSHGMPRIFLLHEELMASPVAHAESLHNALVMQGVTGLIPASAEAVREFIDPALYRAKRTEKMPALSGEHETLYGMMRGEIPTDALFEYKEVSHEAKQ